MGFYGDLDELPLHDILFLLASHAKTGRLSLFTSSDEITLILDRGRIASVTTDDHNLRIGRLLVGQGMVTENQMDQALALQAVIEDSPRIGELLVDLGFVQASQISQAVAAQFHATLFRVLVQSGGTFGFTSSSLENHESLVGDVPIEPMVLDALRQADEWLAAHSRDERVELVDKVLDSSVLDRMEASQRRILTALISGATTTHELSQRTGLPFNKINAGITWLVDAGLVIRSGNVDPRHESGKGTSENSI